MGVRSILVSQGLLGQPGGNEIVPEPKAFVPFPDFFASFLSASKSGGMLQLRFRLSLFGCTDTNRYRLLCKVQVCEAGRGCHPGKMRNHLAEPGANDVAAVSVVVPPELEGKTEVQCHIRYLLIDTITGYRTNYKKLSISTLIR